MDPPPFIMQFDYPVAEGVDKLDRIINSSDRLIDFYGGRGDSLTFVLEAFGEEIKITSIDFGFIYDMFFFPYGYGEVLELLPAFFTNILRNLERTSEKTSFYVELPKKIESDKASRELVVKHLTSMLGGYCDYLTSCPDSKPLNEADGNVYIKQAKQPEKVLPNIEALILTGAEPAE